MPIKIACLLFSSLVESSHDIRICGLVSLHNIVKQVLGTCDCVSKLRWRKCELIKHSK
jgi:hypothetical protein